MNLRYEQADAFDEMLRSEREEIERYRWIESEKIGRDIGLARAATEWKTRYYSDWRSAVLTSGRLSPLAEVIWSKREEIEHYKWIESEKAGRDIGWKRAIREWEQKHYSENRLQLPREVTRQLPGKRPRNPTPKSKRDFSPEHKQKLSASVEAWWANRRTQSSKPGNTVN